MKLNKLYKSGAQTFSFEFFPPKTSEGEESLFQTVRELKTLQPTFVSVTYGAMGTTRSNTLRIATKIKNEIGIEAAEHLTCVGQTKDEIYEVLEDIKASNIENIVALRGDPPQGEKEFRAVDGGFSYASELVAFVRERFKDEFSLFVAGYPETHLECRDKVRDLEHLKIKVDAGADAIITQLFFDNRDYFDFVERARKANIQIPIIPGIMPVANGPQIKRFTTMCGSKIPEDMQKVIEKHGEDAASVHAYGIEYASKQCEELLRSKVPGIHFYTLNKSRATIEIYKNLNLARKE